MAAPDGSPWAYKKEYQLKKGPRLIICVGDILDWPELQRGRPEPLTPIAVVVEAANPRLNGEGPGQDERSAAEVRQRVGPALFKELLGKPWLRPGIRCPTGEAVVTKGYNLNVDWIIHTCGPRRFMPDSSAQCEQVLTSAYRNSLVRAQELGVHRVAFPAISTGLQAHPFKDATRLALSMLRDAEYPLEEVWLVLDRKVEFQRAIAMAAELGLSEYVPPAQPPTGSSATLEQGTALRAQQAGPEPALQPLAARPGVPAEVVAAALTAAGAQPWPPSQSPAVEGSQQHTAEGVVLAQQPASLDAVALLVASEPQQGFQSDSILAAGGPSVYRSSRAEATLPSDAADEAVGDGGVPAARASAPSPPVMPPLLAPQDPGPQPPPLPQGAASSRSLGSRSAAEVVLPMLPASAPQPSPLLLEQISNCSASFPSALEAPQEPPLENVNRSDEAELRRLEGLADFRAEQKQDPTFTLLHYLALLGHTTLQEALEVAAKDPGKLQCFARLASCLIQQQQPQAKDKYGCTPLQLAAACGNLGMVEVLLEWYGLHDNHTLLTQALNHKDLHAGFTALHGAISLGQLEVAVLLLQHGADPQAMDATKKTAFEVAPSRVVEWNLLVQALQSPDALPMSTYELVRARTVHVLMARQEEAQNEQAEQGERRKEEQAEQEELPGIPVWPSVERGVEAMTMSLFDALCDKEQYGTVRALFEHAVHKGFLQLSEAMVEPLMRMLSERQQHARILECVMCAISAVAGDVVAAMLVLIVSSHRAVLRLREWGAANNLLVSYLPGLFQHLIAKLQTMPDDDVRSFVHALSPSTVQSSGGGDVPAAQLGAEAKASAEAPAEVPYLDSAAKHAKLLKMYHCLVRGLSKADYKVVKVFYEEANQELLNDMARYPIYKEFVGLLALSMAKAKRESPLDEGLEGLSATHRIPVSLVPPSQLARDLRKIIAQQPVLRTTAAAAGGGGGAAAAADPGAAAAAKLLGPETLNVGRVLHAAVHGRMTHNVQAAVMSITRWVDADDGQATAVFVTGISMDLLEKLAMRFPSACAKLLLNLLCRDVSGRLAPVQVPATLLYDRTFRVKCSNVHNHFIWQDRQLRRLHDLRRLHQGYSEAVVAVLVDYGVPFDCVVKAAVDLRDSAVDFAALIEEGFSGPELRLLISNDVPLAEIWTYIAESDEIENDYEQDRLVEFSMSQLIRDMLRAKLNPRYVNHLLRDKEIPIRVPQLLSKWQRGVTDEAGTVPLPPWDRRWIDDMAVLKYTNVCARLKCAFDNKLTDAEFYLEDEGDVDEQPLLDREAMREGLLLRAFVNPFWLMLHRWPVAALAWLLLYLRRWVLRPLWRRLRKEARAEHFRELVKARALVIPWRCIADMVAIPQRPAAEGCVKAPNGTSPSPSGADADVSRPARPPQLPGPDQGSNRGILALLVQSDVPVSWYGFTAVKAVVAVHWQEFGQSLVLLSALAHIVFMVLFIVFLFILRKAGEQEAGDMSMIRKRPEMIALLALLGLLSVGGLLEEFAQVWELTLRTWHSHPGNIVDLTSFALVFVIFFMVVGRSSYEGILAVCAIEALVLFIRLVFFASMTTAMGSLMRMVIEIIRDMRHFFLLLVMTFGGFAIAFAALQGPSYSYEAIALKLFSVMLGDWNADFLAGMLHGGNWYMPRLSVILMSVYGVLVLIVLVSLLIAIMNDTYDRIKETEEIVVLRNHARLIVDLESLLTKEMRTKLQEQLLGDYLHVLIPADKVDDFMLSSETVEGDWKGRMRAFRETLRRDMDPQLQRIGATINTLVRAQPQQQSDVQTLVQAQTQLQSDVQALIQAQALRAQLHNEAQTQLQTDIQTLVSSLGVVQEEFRSQHGELALIREHQQGGRGA